MTWKIQGITGELIGQEILVERDTLIGRHQAADLILQSAEISRKHAAFLIKEDALWVQDLASSNGTFVNDLRINNETLLQDGDIVQFASLKFLVLSLEKDVETASLASNVEVQSIVNRHVDDVKPNAESAEPVIEDIVVEEVKPQTVAEKMNEQGMPELTERDSSVQLTKEGMPQGIAIPKPAPIPEGVDVTATVVEPKSIPVEQPITRVEHEKETQKNASIGLITIVVLIIVAIIAWLLIK